MAFDYSEIVQVTKDLISEYGRSVVLSRDSADPKDPAKPWQGNNRSTITQGVDAVFVPASGADLGMDSVTDEMLQRVTEVCLVAQAPQVLLGFDKINDSGVTYQIEWCQVLKPANVILLYVFGVKR